MLPFEDLRKNENSNNIMLYLIPLFPYGWQDLNVPEAVPMHMASALWTNYNPKEDFAKALATELENARIFKDARFDFGRGETDIVVVGKIIDAGYRSKIFSYGLSAYGPLLWWFGLPAGTFSNDISIELRCIDVKSNRELFSNSYKASNGQTAWIYSIMSGSAIDFNYSEMLKDLYKSFLSDLTAHSAAIAARMSVTHSGGA